MLAGIGSCGNLIEPDGCFQGLPLSKEEFLFGMTIGIQKPEIRYG
jgi:hypothetical protein